MKIVSRRGSAVDPQYFSLLPPRYFVRSWSVLIAEGLLLNVGLLEDSVLI